MGYGLGMSLRPAKTANVPAREMKKYIEQAYIIPTSKRPPTTINAKEESTSIFW